jgi:tRNA G18 (ribose-2'-O)-methylase SpoU
VPARIVRISDPSDERVGDFVALNDPGLRRRREQSGGRQGGFFVAEGPAVVRQLLRSPYRVRSLLVTSQGLRALEADVASVNAPVYLASQPLLDSVCGFHFHRGVLASADRRPLPSLADAVAGAGLVVVTEGVNDHENLGALFRNAAAFGAGAVVLDPTSADPLYRRCVRVSMGHVLRLSFARATEWPEAIATLQSFGFEVLALTPSPDADEVGHVARRPRQALLVGAEGPGLSAAALSMADHRVRVPMAPGVDSVNLATAAAIAFHHLRR